MDKTKIVALAAALVLASALTASSQVTTLPFQIAEIRRSEKAFCEVVVEIADKDAAGTEKDARIEGYALVVGINTKQVPRRIREGVLKDAAAKGADLCKTVSGKTYEDPTGGKAVWELIGTGDKAEGTCVVQLPSDIAYKAAVRVKAQLVALSGGKWIEKSRPFERTIKP